MIVTGAASSSAGDPSKLEFTKAGKPIVTKTMRYVELLEDIRNGDIKEVVFAQAGVDRALAIYKTGHVKTVQLTSDDITVADMMTIHGVRATLAPPEPPSPPGPLQKAAQDIAAYWLPSALIVAVYAVVAYRKRNQGDWEDRQKLRAAESEKAKAKAEAEAKSREQQAWEEDVGGQGGSDGRKSTDVSDDAMEFMKVAAKVTSKDLAGGKGQGKVTFKDVAGIGEAKVELMEVVDFFKKPEKFRASGSRIPKGVLLVGPPGTGKTLLARAVAGEAGVAFFSITASEFVEMFVGVGAARMRDLFVQARKEKAAIVFIDELDAVGRKRGMGGSGNDERDQTLNQLLSELDGFNNSKSTIVVMAATNRPDVLDTALVRPGRFDRKVMVGEPDVFGREEVLEVHASKVPLGDDVDLKEVAMGTMGYTGAGLANIINIAALIAAKDQRAKVMQSDLMSALELQTMGKLTDDHYSISRQKRLAVHEAGCALLTELLPTLEKVELVTIVPRENEPEGQIRFEYNAARTICGTFTRQYLTEQLIMVLGGRAAEELIYGPDDMSTINEAALTRAREIVSKMVMTAGMCDVKEINTRTMAYPMESESFLKDATIQFVPQHISSATMNIADQEMLRLLQEYYAESKRILHENRACLDAIVQKLLEQGTLVSSEVHEVMDQHGLRQSEILVSPK